MTISDLITQAIEKTGSGAKLAELLGVPQPAITMWKNGARPCPPEDQARIAAILGADPREALVSAVLERHAGTPKGEALAALFSGCEHPPPKTKKAGAGFALCLMGFQRCFTMKSIAQTVRLAWA